MKFFVLTEAGSVASGELRPEDWQGPGRELPPDSLWHGLVSGRPILRRDGENVWLGRASTPTGSSTNQPTGGAL